MFNIFQKKCPICHMKLQKGKDYPEEFGKKFCSENCQEEYRKKITEKQPKSHKKCCH